MGSNVSTIATLSDSDKIRRVSLPSNHFFICIVPFPGVFGGFRFRILHAAKIFRIILPYQKINCNITGRENFRHGTKIFLGRINEYERRVFCNIFPSGRKMPLSRRSYLQFHHAERSVASVQIEQNAAAVPLEGGVADDFQIGVDLRAVGHDFQSFPVEHRLLIAPEPFGIHVRKETVEAAADEVFQGKLLDF